MRLGIRGWIDLLETTDLANPAEGGVVCENVLAGASKQKCTLWLEFWHGNLKN